MNKNNIHVGSLCLQLVPVGVKVQKCSPETTFAFEFFAISFFSNMCIKRKAISSHDKNFDSATQGMIPNLTS